MYKVTLKEQIEGYDGVLPHIFDATTKSVDSPMRAFAPKDADLAFEFTACGHRCYVITELQAKAFNRVIEHQGREHFVAAWYDTLAECLILQFKHIYIGIESDGYAHS